MRTDREDGGASHFVAAALKGYVNDVARTDSGFDVDSNAVTIVSAEGAETLPLQSKARVASEILDRIEKLLAPRPAQAGQHT